MGYKKGILGAASVLALIAGTQGPASASINSKGDGSNSAPSTGISEASQQSDPLFDFLKLTNQGESVENAAQSMFGNVSQAQLDQLPQFLHGVSTLGWSAADIERLKEALIQIVNSSDADEATRQAVVAELQSQNQIQLADNTDNNDNNSNNNNNNDNNGPDTTSTVGGGGFVGHGGTGGMYGH